MGARRGDEIGCGVVASIRREHSAIRVVKNAAANRRLGFEAAQQITGGVLIGEGERAGGVLANHGRSHLHFDLNRLARIEITECDQRGTDYEENGTYCGHYDGLQLSLDREATEHHWSPSWKILATLRSLELSFRRARSAAEGLIVNRTLFSTVSNPIIPPRAQK